jgi:hypothetical protein
MSDELVPEVVEEAVEKKRPSVNYEQRNQESLLKSKN